MIRGAWLDLQAATSRRVSTVRTDTVRAIFRLRTEEQLSQAEISRRVRINHSTVHSILRNRAYLGQLRYGDDWINGLHDPLVTEQQFQPRIEAAAPASAAAKTSCPDASAAAYADAPCRSWTRRTLLDEFLVRLDGLPDHLEVDISGKRSHPGTPGMWRPSARREAGNAAGYCTYDTSP